jgi:Cu(I)/Ag(I) efflux system membrane fusion protein
MKEKSRIVPAGASECRRVGEAPASHRPRPATLLTLVFTTIAALLLAAGCSRQSAGGKPADVDYYTCTMHPSVKNQNPKDKCPICSMDLTPVKKRAAPTAESESHAGGHDHTKMLAEQATQGKSGAETPGEFTVPLERQQLIGVTYATVQTKPLQATVRAVGVVAYDKLQHWDFVSRVDGYIEKLYVASKGELVRKDQPLVTIYSPDLFTSQREFVDLLRLRDQAKQSNQSAAQESTERLIAAARQRLRLWNITPEQLEDLERTRQPSETLTLRAPFRGVVQSVGVDQGRKVMSGDHLVDVADLSVVWVWAEFYQEELPLLKTNLAATVTTSAHAGEKFAGKLALIDPFLNEAKRTVRARLNIENADFKLRPEMYVDVELAVDLGEGLTIPFHAVLPTGRHNIVFVEKGEGRLEPRYVELGRKFGELYHVKEGLKEGERVVASANFLIDAEAKVQGALRSW